MIKKKEISLASLMIEITDPKIINDPNTVKVIVDNKNFAIYFSRFGLPYKRDSLGSIKCFKHIGVYAFRKNALIEFYNQEMTPLEKSEKIECLRYIESQKKIKMISTSFSGVSIDTQADLEFAKSIWKNNE
jgi:3-deoxy-manno-octulosonate cytidylyltransferase (CMP-KDO synthetase)